MEYTVRPIPTMQVFPWLKYKHYAKRIPPISFAFGLYDKGLVLIGVCTFGIPASRFEDIQQPYELNRLVVNDGLPKNTLSFFVGECLRLFPRPNVIVSYADPNMGHHGYIYQATNWIYTGLGSKHDDCYINGELLHSKSIFNKYGTNSLDSLRAKGLDVVVDVSLPKHRYFFLVGSRKEVRAFSRLLKYPVLPYPKGENKRYDSSFKPETNAVLF